jgi:NifU-like protein involved in Fe-S cluster formation
MSIEESLYNARILELAADIPRLYRLKNPHATATAHSKLCGSTIVVDLCVVDGCVSDFGCDIKACALGKSSAAIMAANIIGSSEEEVRTVCKQFRAMLKDGAAPPQGKWSELAILTPVRGYRARHASTLLAFDAVVKAFDSIKLI